MIHLWFYDLIGAENIYSTSLTGWYKDKRNKGRKSIKVCSAHSANRILTFLPCLLGQWEARKLRHSTLSYTMVMRFKHLFDKNKNPRSQTFYSQFSGWDNNGQNLQTLLVCINMFCWTKFIGMCRFLKIPSLYIFKQFHSSKNYIP